jgi:hypothetical protein
MQSDAIVRDWERNFGTVAPVGHLCRSALQERWMRIHSLPNSKRYASSTDEYDILLARQNAVATALLGAGSECIFFCCEFPGEPASRILDLLPAPLSGFFWLPELAALADDYEDIRIGAILVSWQPGPFDVLIRARADDEIGPVLFANMQNRTAFAPYDGGADLFLESPEMIPPLKHQWVSWLPTHSDGV